jgi:light-regulated signal transduction histidine kinase (bacteriophytochrome)
MRHRHTEIPLLSETELPEVTVGIDTPIAVDRLLNRITRGILRSPDLDHTLAVTAAEVRAFLQVDRVKIYRFHGNGDGQVVAEAIHEQRLPSLLGLNFPADDIPPDARKLFVQARMRSIVNVAAKQIGQGFAVHPETGAPLDESIRFRPLDPCHEEYLKAMGVQSSLVLPILHEGGLWGLLVAHHTQPWETDLRGLEGLQMVVDQLALAIAQFSLWQEADLKARREATINRISKHLYPINAIDIPTALAAIVKQLQGCGGRIYVDRQTLMRHFQAEESPQEAGSHDIFVHGTQPQAPSTATPLEGLHSWSHYFQPAHLASDATREWAISDLYKVPELRNIQAAFRGTTVRGLLVVPLTVGEETFGYLSVFRDEINTERLWAGRFDPDMRQDQPRLSFDVWKESKQGQAHAWTENDRLLAQALGQQLSAALQQHALYQRVQHLNQNLEQQVRDRTATLHRTLEELKEIQAQLVQAEKMSSLGQLVASVAHEVNNPINFIEGNLSYARQYLIDVLPLLDQYQQAVPPDALASPNLAEEIDVAYIREDFPQLFASMEHGAERIQQVVKTLLNFSRHGQAEVKTVNLHEGLDSTLLILHYRMRAHFDKPGIQVVKQYGKLPPVHCYVSQLNQVFMNLLNNAVQAIEQRWLMESAPQPGIIKVQTTLVEASDAEPPEVEIIISDNGCGMAADVQPHIFEPFFTTKGVGHGTGLGLSICHQIVVDQHGGRLECHSAPGEGAQFKVRLPLQIPATSPDTKCP